MLALLFNSGPVQAHHGTHKVNISATQFLGPFWMEMYYFVTPIMKVNISF